MTEAWPANPSDERRAQDILESLRRTIKPFHDYKMAINSGYVPWGPPTRAGEIHFFNRANAKAEDDRFDGTAPTALLYKPTPGGGYVLVGAMYTAPSRLSLADLNRRVPLSVARWHRHLDRCIPGSTPQGRKWTEESFRSVRALTTEKDCVRAGGRYLKDSWRWMLHVYPYDGDVEAVWRRGM